MAIRRLPDRRFAVLALLPGILIGCSSRREQGQAESAACNALARSVAEQDAIFVARVKTIRAQHLLIQDYDRQMIAAINERRAAIESSTLMALSVSDEVAGCSGKPLEDMRHRAHLEMANLRAFLNDFNRALHYDPAGVFIDQP